jgi:excisionase family DNA binding protein
VREIEPPRLVYGIEETCYQTNLSRSTVMTLIASGELASLKVGARRLVPRDSIQDFIRMRMTRTNESAAGARLPAAHREGSIGAPAPRR